MSVRIEHGDCRDVMSTLDAASIDACITDPPYHLTAGKKGGSGIASLNLASPAGRARATTGFMGKSWDGGDVAFQPGTWGGALRVLKPGAYLLAFGGTRTYHRLACAIEDAGFEIRDQIGWVFGSGFPKHRACLKPAWEPIVLARKPAARATPLNIDECRIPQVDASYARNCSGDRGHADNRSRDLNFAMGCGRASKIGRWPANVIHDGSDEVMAAFAAFGSDKGAIAPVTRRGSDKFRNSYGRFAGQEEAGATFQGDTGTAARFFYAAKAGAADRLGSKHPTVKPVDLIAYLCRLVTPPGGTILDPFAGSGTLATAAMREGFNAILIEREAEYVADIRRRLQHVSGGDTGLFVSAAE